MALVYDNAPLSTLLSETMHACDVCIKKRKADDVSDEKVVMVEPEMKKKKTDDHPSTCACCVCQCEDDDDWCYDCVHFKDKQTKECLRVEESPRIATIDETLKNKHKLVGRITCRSCRGTKMIGNTTTECNNCDMFGQHDACKECKNEYHESGDNGINWSWDGVDCVSCTCSCDGASDEPKPLDKYGKCQCVKFWDREDEDVED